MTIRSATARYMRPSTLVNDGDADIIDFHKPVLSKEQPGMINLCSGLVIW